jgi:hypothetical protein
MKPTPVPPRVTSSGDKNQTPLPPNVEGYFRPDEGQRLARARRWLQQARGCAQEGEK